MPRLRLPILIMLGLLVALTVVVSASAEGSGRGLTQATPPVGPMVSIPDQANLRSGPGANYTKIGVLVKGQEAKALGRSPGGEWIQIEYIGVPEKVAWVYAPLVNLNVPNSSLPIVEPPPTPTPPPFPTIDPAIVLSVVPPTSGPTRLPTFTAASSVAQPTPLPVAGLSTQGGFPPALAIIGFFVVGLFGVVVSFLRSVR